MIVLFWFFPHNFTVILSLIDHWYDDVYSIILSMVAKVSDLAKQLLK